MSFEIPSRSRTAYPEEQIPEKRFSSHASFPKKGLVSRGCSLGSAAPYGSTQGFRSRAGDSFREVSKFLDPPRRQLPFMHRQEGMSMRAVYPRRSLQNVEEEPHDDNPYTDSIYRDELFSHQRLPRELRKGRTSATSKTGGPRGATCYHSQSYQGVPPREPFRRSPEVQRPSIKDMGLVADKRRQRGAQPQGASLQAKSAPRRPPVKPTKVFCPELRMEIDPANPWHANIGVTVPNFFCSSGVGEFFFHEYLDSNPKLPWTVFFTCPADYTPASTTEAHFKLIVQAFALRGCKLCALSISRSSLRSVPVIQDSSRAIGQLLGLLDPEDIDKDGRPLLARALMVISPEKTVRVSIIYPSTVKQNFDEILRLIESMQLAAEAPVATPADWKACDQVVIDPDVPCEETHNFRNSIEPQASQNSYPRYPDAPFTRYSLEGGRR